MSTRCSGALPEGFVYLDAVAPEITQRVRYASKENFTGGPVDGYLAKRIVCTARCAAALREVQRLVQRDGFELVVYDAFRPQRAVNHFARWSRDVSAQGTKSAFFPHVDKRDVFALGYIAARSGHSRGSTVDVTLLRVGDAVTPLDDPLPAIQQRILCGHTDRPLPFSDDGTLDMGTSFDLFDDASHHDSPLVEALHTTRRDYLRDAMRQCGFRALQDEWWHYTLCDEPFPDTYFDFDIR